MRRFTLLLPRLWTRLILPIPNFVLQFGKQFTLTRMNNDMPIVSNGGYYQSTSFEEKDPIYKKILLNGTYQSIINHHDEHSSVRLPLSIYDSKDLTIDSEIKLFSPKDFLHWIIGFSFVYFLWFTSIAGLSMIHFIIFFILLILFLITDRTRRLVFASFIYLTYLFLYDTLHLIPNYTVSKIHIEDVYLLEKRYFGIDRTGNRITLNEYFQKNHIPFLDVFTGFSYLCWIPIPIAYSLYLYRYRSKRDYMDFAFTFLLTNILGFIIYYIVPTAPPWYVEIYGFQFNLKAVGNPAGFIHFDQILGLRIFSSMYSKNANVFAAIPSLHAAYPLLTVLYGSLSKRCWLHLFFVFFTLSVWFSAVYSRHHYVLDVLAGGLCALTAFFLYRYLSRRSCVERYLDNYSKLI